MNKAKRANRFYAGATAVVLVGVAALATTVGLFHPPALDERTLCPTDRPISAHTLVIVDRTDRWNKDAEATLTELIESAQRNTKQYEKFSIVSMDSKMSTHPLFSVCNPGAPNPVSDIYRGRRYTQRDFDQKFIGAADTVLARLSKPQQAASSPIVEYVHRWLGRDDFNANVATRRLVLISDMRQNSPLLSVYRGGDAKLASLVQKQFGESGRGVSYDIYFLAHGHDRNVSEDDVEQAWSKAFQNISANYEWRQAG
jgi:hypothetical protein